MAGDRAATRVFLFLISKKKRPMAASDERLAGGTRAAASYPMDADQSDSLAFDSVANR